ncbi:MAG: methyltransferase domain-containing protein [Chloroflexota bacterium]|mgnify:FL=1
MDHFKNIYTHHADKYHVAIAAEDVDGHLKAALRRCLGVAASPRGKRILDLGTGSGRLPLLFANESARMIGLDLHWGMLKQNQIERKNINGNWELVNGDMRCLPFPSASAEVVTAGWAIGHLRKWYEENWQIEIGKVINEMIRVATGDGVVIIIETLGTGSLTPAPPAPHLADYYAWLEGEWGFERKTISTDYQFASVDEAIEKTEFFFGAEMSEKIRQNNWSRLPEWTGIWVKKT